MFLVQARTQSFNLLSSSCVCFFFFFLMISHLKSSSAVPTVLCFGDSWTDGNAFALANHLRMNGLSHVKVVNKDYWGSTAEYFASNPSLLPDAVKRHNADYVLLSMGGNDFKNIYWRQKQYVLPTTAVAQIEKSLSVVLDELFKVHPNVKVVTYGYDFPGNVDGLLSGRLWGQEKEMESSTKLLMWLYNSVGIRFINYAALQLGNSYEKLSKGYTAKGYSFTYVPLWGSLQSAAHKVDNPIPRLDEPSPAAYMQDPIHANDKGFGVLLGNLYNAYFGKELTQKA